MNKLTIFAAAALLLSACQVTSFEEEEPGTNPAKGEKTMHFKLSPYKVSSMDDLAENEEESLNTAMYAAAAPKNATDHLLLAIYDAKGKLVDNISYQDKNDPNLAEYGKFTHRLQYGKYTVLALGWNSDQKCTVHRPDSITFSEGWTPHAFLCRKNIVVSESFSDTRALTLKRCVAKFTVKLKQAGIPENIRDFVFSISGGSSNLNGETGYSAKVSDFSRTMYTPADPSNINLLTTYSFLPADSTDLTIKLTAHDKDGSIVHEKVFEKVPMKINYRTIYTGEFFSASVDNTVEFDDVYDGDINMEF